MHKLRVGMPSCCTCCSPLLTIAVPLAADRSLTIAFVPPPSSGYRIYQVAGNIKSGSNCELGGSNPFKACDASTANRLLAVETDATCVVRVFILGDSK